MLQHKARLKIKWFLGVFLLACFFLGSEVFAGEGTTGLDFLNLIPGARTAAMADCYLASGNDAESLFVNPAGIIGLLNPQIGMGHLSWWEGVYYDAIWGVQPLGEIGSLGMHGALLTVLPFNSTEDPEATTERASSLFLAGTYAVKLQRALVVGGQAKYCYSSLGPFQTWGVAVDLGAQYFLLNDQLVIAAAVKHLGVQTAYIETNDLMPLEFGCGASYQFWPDDAYRLMLAMDVTIPVQGKVALGLGAEFWLENILALRCGVKGPQDTGDWLSVGTGVRWQNIHMDYSLAPLGLLGMVHRFSLGYDFGSQRRLARPKLAVAISMKQFVTPEGEAGYTIKFIPKVSIAAGLAKWEIEIKNDKNEIVRKLQDVDILPMTITWDGMDALGTRVDMEKTYYFLMQVADRQGYTAKVTGEILPVSITKLPKLTVVPRDLYAGQVSFLPKDVRDAQEWFIDIVSDDGSILKKYQGMGMIPKDFSWDGKNENNQKVAVKRGYHFVLRVKDKSNNEMKSVAPIILVDAGSKAWTSSEVTLDEQIPFRFEPTDIKVKRWVFDVVEKDTGKIVRSYEGTAPLPESIVWDARDDQGKKVSSTKQYTYVLRMQDQIGNVWQQADIIAKTEVKILPSSEGVQKIKVEQILFEFNQAELKPSMHQKLRKVSDLIRAHQAGKTRIIIEGHTDEIGTDAYNFDLSLKRANMVMRYLVEDEGLPSAQMEMKGYGKKLPVAQSNTPESQAMNRRVEITLYFLP